MRKLLIIMAGLALALSGASVAVADHRPGHPKPKAAKKAKTQNQSKVAICHRTASTKNPTVTIRVSEKAAAKHIQEHGDTPGACAADGEPRGFERLTATLTAVQGATGSGTAVVDVRLTKKFARVCYTLNVTGFTATAAHIHTFATQTIGGQSFAAGGIVVPLETPNANGVARDCTKVARAIGQALLANPGAFFVNVHSAAFPQGQIQGALTSS